MRSAMRCVVPDHSFPRGADPDFELHHEFGHVTTLGVNPIR